MRCVEWRYLTYFIRGETLYRASGDFKENVIVEMIEAVDCEALVVANGELYLKWRNNPTLSLVLQ